MTKNTRYHLVAFSAILFLSACGGKGTESSSEKSPGQESYEKQCSRCHGNDGNLGLSGAKSLSKTNLSAADMIPIITNGSSGGIMPAYKGILTDEEIKNVAEYIETRIKK